MQNCSGYSQITTIQKAVSEVDGEMEFYEFPNLYSEYNTSDVSQFEGTSWYKRYKPSIQRVETISIDSVARSGEFTPHLIKIDVEGAELSVLSGGKEYLRQHSPLVVMEYLAAVRSNEPHREAVVFMKTLGYQTNIINDHGLLQPVNDVEQWLTETNTDSDNIVFQKK